ncbi:pentapeptide repeat-containing protein [Streptomyces sp. NPDC055134]
MVEPHGACLEHLSDTDRASYLAALTPGSDVDHRGTCISEQLLQVLLDGVRDPSTSRPCFGDAWFDRAQFSGDAVFRGVQFSGDAVFSAVQFSGSAWFDRAQFSGPTGFSGAQFSGDAVFSLVQFSDGAGFSGAQFSGDAGFSGARFSGDAWFSGARFSGDAWFGGVQFSGDARFGEVQFSGDAWFDRAQFLGDAKFSGAQFSGPTVFSEVQFSGDAEFNRARFEETGELGPLACAGALHLAGALFGAPVTVEAAAREVVCQRTRWSSTAALRLRFATVDMSDAVVEFPLSIAAQPNPFVEPLRGGVLSETQLAGAKPEVRIKSLSGTDAAHVVLHSVDLSGCRFSGSVHLDQLRLEGECPLAPASAGWRSTERRTLAEEHHWRAANGHAGWTAAPSGAAVVGPAVLAPVYRALRKSFEDGKNEPDAADFYYGEMEMRRHDDTRPRGERALLAAYWALSGYGLRASRALGCLLGAMAATVLVMMLWGLPIQAPAPSTTGRLTGQDITLTTEKPDPANPRGPLASRLTSDRWEKSLRIVVNSVVFRSSGQDLTITGTYTEMASRFTEPVLLGLAVLAIRGRVKR